MISQRARAIDRSATNISKIYVTSVGIHAKTERWRYTVPSGRNALLLGGHLQMRRAASGGATGNARGLVTLEIDGIERAHICSCFLSQLQLANSTYKQKNIPRASMLIIEGQSIKCTTADLSAAGSVVYNISANVMEFNA